MRTATVLSAVLAASLSFGAATVQAQSATIQATATVLSAITVTGTNLAFGNVTPGVNKTVAITDAGAGEFTVTKAAATSVALTFTLPTQLTSGGNTMPIGTWTGGWNNTANNAAGATTFTPSAAATTVPSGGANLWVWVGGTVSPAAAQAAGPYTGNVSMQVVYL
ncbi:MAG TPA: hypothetical protein VH763_17140 [Gemmatimonadales bacterium]|jgi:hypothetical protein